jgi:hypothetical protein
MPTGIKGEFAKSGQFLALFGWFNAKRFDNSQTRRHFCHCFGFT